MVDSDVPLFRFLLFDLGLTSCPGSVHEEKGERSRHLLSVRMDTVFDTRWGFRQEGRSFGGQYLTYVQMGRSEVRSIYTGVSIQER